MFWTRARLLALTMLVIAVAACGDGGSADTKAAGKKVDGTLTTSDGKVIRDWGEERDRKRLVARFAKLQRDFRGGRMKAACANVTDFGLAQFTPGRTGFETPCPAKLRAFAAELERRGVEPVRLRVLWGRTYELIASIWVEDPKGERMRLGFTDAEGGHMKFELGVIAWPEVLHGYLIGARRYLAR